MPRPGIARVRAELARVAEATLGEGIGKVIDLDQARRGAAEVPLGFEYAQGAARDAAVGAAGADQRALEMSGERLGPVIGTVMDPGLGAVRARPAVVRVERDEHRGSCVARHLGARPEARVLRVTVTCQLCGAAELLRHQLRELQDHVTLECAARTARAIGRGAAIGCFPAVSRIDDDSHGAAASQAACRGLAPERSRGARRRDWRAGHVPDRSAMPVWA
jgi:hypothetical protein